jgi:hypothetical protein
MRWPNRVDLRPGGTVDVLILIDQMWCKKCIGWVGSSSYARASEKCVGGATTKHGKDLNLVVIQA